ncbi:helix-turn-helix domain-containing protein, partial [Sutterella sp.]|uniref:helix-turn-helix domain-containing protein n=1 Tax=Sutterella sp. TaxID=1981025 RepID=UPI003FD768D6
MFRDYLNGEIDWPHYRGEDIVRLRERLNLTQEALGELLRVRPETVRRWETENVPVGGVTDIALCALDKLGAGVFS